MKSTLNHKTEQSDRGNVGLSAPRHSLRISLPGLMCITGMLVICVMAINTQTNLLFAMIGVFAGVLIGSALWAGRAFTRMTVQRKMPAHLRQGRADSFSYDLDLTACRWPLRSVWIEESGQFLPAGDSQHNELPRGFVGYLPARRTGKIKTWMRPRQRGLIRLEQIRLRSGFPFGLFVRRLIQPAPATIPVWPAVGRISAGWLDRLIFRDDPRQAAEGKARAAGVEEFYGVREYRHGDNPHWIHWRGSAKTGELLVREMTQPRHPRLIVILPEPPGEGAGTEHERAIRFAATLCRESLRRAWPTGLALGGETAKALAPATGMRQQANIMDALAAQRTGPDRKGPGELLHQFRPAQVRNAQLILIDPTGKSGLNLSRPRGCAAPIIIDRHTMAQVYGDADLAD